MIDSGPASTAVKNNVILGHVEVAMKVKCLNSCVLLVDW